MLIFSESIISITLPGRNSRKLKKKKFKYCSKKITCVLGNKDANIIRMYDFKTFLKCNNSINKYKLRLTWTFLKLKVIYITSNEPQGKCGCVLAPTGGTTIILQEEQQQQTMYST